MMKLDTFFFTTILLVIEMKPFEGDLPKLSVGTVTSEVPEIDYY